MGNEESTIYLKNLNILIVGKPNVGKTTLIFNIFNHKINEDDSLLEYSRFAKYTKKRTHINLYDTLQYPSNPHEQQEFDKLINFFINEKLKLDDIDKKIHFIWYCIDSKSRKIEEYEKKFISQFSKILPIIIVLTKSDDEDTIFETMTTIEQSKLNINRIVPVLSENTKNLNSYGLDNLIYYTIKSLPNHIKSACKSYYNIINEIEDVYDEEILTNQANNLHLNGQNKSRINIIITGKTGIGKSALINEFFKKEFIGMPSRPFTKNIREISAPHTPITIYDTPGLVMNESQKKELKKDIIKLIKNGISTGDINKYIHCILYCVRSGSSRFVKDEAAFIKELTEDSCICQIPLIIVITQSYEKIITKEFKKHIRSFNLNQVEIVSVVAKDKSDQNKTIKAYGLDKLSDVMNDSISSSITKNFIKRDYVLTQKELQKLVAPMLAKK